MTGSEPGADARRKEALLQRESRYGEIGEIRQASRGDILLIDLGAYFASRDHDTFERVSAQMRHAPTSSRRSRF